MEHDDHLADTEKNNNGECPVHAASKPTTGPSHKLAIGRTGQPPYLDLSLPLGNQTNGTP